jgi:hypothetical protein
VIWRTIGSGLLAAAAFAVAGCSGNGGSEGEGSTAGGGCATAKADLQSTIAERDRLFVDQQLGAATKACAGELDAEGDTAKCTEARADLEAAAAAVTPPPNIDALVEAAVEACVGTTITSTIPAP